MKQMTEKRPEAPEQVIAARRKRLANQAEITSFAARGVLLVLLLCVIFGIVFGITPMKNNDMSPGIGAGDLLLYFRLENELRAKDIVVWEEAGTQYVGRIVAQGGDAVEITEDYRLKINGSVVIENNIYYSTPRYDSGVEYPLTLGEDQYFILCDYREGGKDSRYCGAVDRSEIKGKVITVIRRNNL